MRTALVQFKPRKGDIEANFASIRAVLTSLALLTDPPELVVFPETTLTGYFLEGAVADLALGASEVAQRLDDLWRVSGATTPCDLVVGFYENACGTLHNSAVYVRCGEHGGPRVLHVHRKMFLPTYGMFDEQRFVTRGRRLSVFETSFGTTALLICEDAWHSVMITIAALKGARLIIVPSAPPGRGLTGDYELESNSRWKSVLSSAAAEHGVFVLYAALTGFEGGRGMSGGTCALSPRGHLLATASPLGACTVTVVLDGREVDLARKAMARRGDLSAVLADLWLDCEIPILRPHAAFQGPRSS